MTLLSSHKNPNLHTELRKYLPISRYSSFQRKSGLFESSSSIDVDKQRNKEREEDRRSEFSLVQVFASGNSCFFSKRLEHFGVAEVDWMGSKKNIFQVRGSSTRRSNSVGCWE